MRSQRSREYTVAAAVFLATLAVYLPALKNDFVGWDDTSYVIENQQLLTRGSDLLAWAFSTFDQRTWHPLTWISHALDRAIWGLDPFGHHLTSIVLHGLNAFLVVLLAGRLAAAKGMMDAKTGAMPFLDGNGLLLFAGATGLLFGLHPLHVEPAAWISGRKELLSAFFYIAAVLQYLRHAAVAVGTGRASVPGRHYWFALGFFVLALLSKTMAVTLPAVLLILDWYLGDRLRSRATSKSAWVEKVPFVFLSAAAAVLVVAANSSDVVTGEVPFGLRLVAAVHAIGFYLGKMLLPVYLLPFYVYPDDATLRSLAYEGTVVLGAGMVLFCAFAARKRSLWPALGSVYLITLLPVLGLVQISEHAAADRYAYLPSVAPFLALGLAAAWTWKRTASPGGGISVSRTALIALFLATISVLAVLTEKQIAVWNNTLSLWSHVIENEPDRIAVAYNNRGWAYYEAGRADLAVKDYDRAIALVPDSDMAYENRGMALQALGRTAQALEDYNRAIMLNPFSAGAYNERGRALAGMGWHEQAIADFDAAIALDPLRADYFRNRGQARESVTQLRRAIEDYTRALFLKPDYAEVYARRGELYRSVREPGLALPDLRKACDLGHDESCGALNREGAADEQ